MPKKSKEHVANIVSKIRQYRKQGLSEDQIKHDLALIDRTYQRYDKIIREQDHEAWLNVTKNELEPELLKLKSSLEDTYKIADDLSKQKVTEENHIMITDILEACKAKDDARLSIVQLITEGPDYINHVDEAVGKKETKQMDTKTETAK